MNCGVEASKIGREWIDGLRDRNKFSRRRKGGEGGHDG